MPPKAKKPRIEHSLFRITPAAKRFNPDDVALPSVVPPNPDKTIRLKIDKFPTALRRKEDILSEVKIINGFPWQLKICENGFLSLMCHYSREARVWCVKARRIVRMMTNRGTFEEVKYCWNENEMFTSKKSSLRIMNMGEKMKETNDRFLLKNTLILDVEIHPDREPNFHRRVSVDFSTESSLLDTELNIGENKIFVNKQLLATHSLVFREHFFGEKREGGLMLDDVKFEEFLFFLKLFHRMENAVNETNAEFVLKLAQKFKVQFLVDHVEKYYGVNRMIKISEKLRIADKYGLDTLLGLCLYELREDGSQRTEVRSAKAAQGIAALSPVTRNKVYAACPLKKGAIDWTTYGKLTPEMSAAIHAHMNRPEVPVPLPDNSIRIKIDNYRKYLNSREADVYSEVKAIGGFLWQLRFTPDTRLYLVCVHSREARVWAVRARRVVKTITRNKGFEEFKENAFEKSRNEFDQSKLFTPSKTSQLIASLGSRIITTDQQWRYLSNGDLTLDVEITPDREASFTKKLQIDFTEQSEMLETEVTLAEEKKVFVNKQLLSTHSPVLRELFREKKEGELILEDVEYEAFIAFLKMVHRAENTVTESTAEPVLKLALRFKVASLIDHVEKFYFHDKNVRMSERLRMADTYGLKTLMWGSLIAMAEEGKHRVEVRGLKGSATVSQLSEETRKRVAAIAPEAKKKEKAVVVRGQGGRNLVGSDGMIREGDLAEYVRVSMAKRGFGF